EPLCLNCAYYLWLLLIYYLSSRRCTVLTRLFTAEILMVGHFGDPSRGRKLGRQSASSVPSYLQRSRKPGFGRRIVAVTNIWFS
ncbi:hypothetical protein V8D89_005410, partial [Ganoderma adspersum]